MGIVDTGQASTGPVSYNTSSFEGSVTIETLSVCAAASPCGSTELGFQLNAVLGFEDGGNWYAYWVQDVMVVDTGSHSVIGFEDNIWNFSDYGATMYSSTISGYGAVQSGVYAEGFEFPAGIYVYPGTYELILNTSVNADGQPIVQVMFDAGQDSPPTTKRHSTSSPSSPILTDSSSTVAPRPPWTSPTTSSGSSEARAVD